MRDAGRMYFEDLVPGRRFECPTWDVTADDIVRFAREFDPQPFHTDPEAAAGTLFNGLAASGWHTGAMMMGMATRSTLQPVNGHVGMGVERMRFLQPVRPGDTLRMEIEVLDARRSGSRPRFGVVRVRWRAWNQAGDAVAEAIPSMWVEARTAAARDEPA